MEPSILEVLASAGEAQLISEVTWARAMAIEAGTIFAKVVCASCKKERRVKATWGHHVDAEMARGAVTCSKLGWSCEEEKPEGQQWEVTILPSGKGRRDADGTHGDDGLLDVLMNTVSMLKTQRSSSKSDTFAKTVRRHANLPRFAGEHSMSAVRAWLKQVEEVFRKHGVTDGEMQVELAEGPFPGQGGGLVDGDADEREGSKHPFARRTGQTHA